MDIGSLFPAGPILSEDRQIGRGPAIEALTDKLMAGDIVRVFDRRRWGKSSAARAAIARLATEGLVALRLPLDEYPTSAADAAYLANAFAPAGEGAATAARTSASRLGGILGRAGQAVDNTELAAVGGLLAGLAPESLTMRAVLERVPDELEKSGRQAAFAIDEAHLIAKWSRDDRAALRAFFARDDRRTGIVLASSDRKAEQKLKKSDVLGYLGEQFSLPPIAEDDWRHGLRERFTTAGVPITDEALTRLLFESRCHPYCTMLLAKHCAEVAQPFGEVTDSVVTVALPTVSQHEAWGLR